MTEPLSLMHELVDQRAQSIARDVSGDNPKIDTSYDVYVEELAGEIYGLIDMGDAGRWAFRLRGNDLDDTELDPHDLYHMIWNRRWLR